MHRLARPSYGETNHHRCPWTWPGPWTITLDVLPTPAAIATVAACVAVPTVPTALAASGTAQPMRVLEPLAVHELQGRRAEWVCILRGAARPVVYRVPLFTRGSFPVPRLA